MQAVVESAIERVTRNRITIDASGRTDAGAHAYRQVIAFDASTDLPAETLRRAINANLPYDVSLADVRDAHELFHPRYDAVSRTYRYVIWNRRARSPHWSGLSLHVPVHLDERLMDGAARLLEGRHDFSSFVPLRQQGIKQRMVYSSTCRREGDLVCFEIEANSFMRQMVRAIAGTLIRVGLGKMTLDEFAEVLARGSRSAAADTAPACGLYLVDVRYPCATETTQVISTDCRERRSEETS